MLEYLVELRWPGNPEMYRRYQQHDRRREHLPAPFMRQEHRRVSAPDDASAAWFARTDVAREHGISIEDVTVLDEPRARPVPARVDDGAAYVNLYVDDNGRMHCGGIYANPESCEHARGKNTSRRFLGSFPIQWQEG